MTKILFGKLPDDSDWGYGCRFVDDFGLGEGYGHGYGEGYGYNYIECCGAGGGVTYNYSFGAGDGCKQDIVERVEISEGSS